MRLIDADALLAALGMSGDCDHCPTNQRLQGWLECQCDRKYTKMDFCDWISGALTVEPDPYCRECKHCEKYNDNDYRYCKLWRRETTDEWSCNRGERDEMD